MRTVFICIFWFYENVISPIWNLITWPFRKAWSWITKKTPTTTPAAAPTGPTTGTGTTACAGPKKKFNLDWIGNAAKAGIAISITLLAIWGLSFMPPISEMIKGFTARPKTLAVAVKEPDFVSVELNSKLSKGKIENGAVPIQKGKAIVFEKPQGMIVEGLNPNDLKDNNFEQYGADCYINPADAVCFTVPGKEGNFFLSENTPTVVKSDVDGYLRFSLCYPGTLSDFTTLKETETAKGKTIEAGTVNIVYNVAESYPDWYEGPRQFVRLGGPAASLFPNITITPEYPDMKL